MTNIETYTAAVRAFAALVRMIPESAWEKQGLGVWDVRALVGHASRSLTTVSTYLHHPTDHEDVPSAVDYYVRIQEYVATSSAEAVAERGRQAGRDLGADPAAAVDGLVEQVLGELAAADDPVIAVIGGLGIRLSSYLPTRVFELAVHGLDIIAATGVDFTMPEDVLADATALAARISVALGHGETLLMALTGRAGLPPSFSVV